MIWFTADTHFFHANIIAYCRRPFASVQEMHDVLVRNWTESCFAADDVIYHLGDVSFGTPDATYHLLKMLPGHKVLVRGSHDGTLTRTLKYGFDAVVEPGAMRVALPDGWAVRLSHEPMWGKEPTLCGHVHERWRARKNCVNVGVDQWGFRPVPWHTVAAMFHATWRRQASAGREA